MIANNDITPTNLTTTSLAEGYSILTYDCDDFEIYYDNRIFPLPNKKEVRAITKKCIFINDKQYNFDYRPG